MKKIVLLILVVLSNFAFAQMPTIARNGIWIGGFTENPTGFRAGQIYWNSTEGKLKLYDGTNWGNLIDDSGFVKYSGATQTLNLGTQQLVTSGNITSGLINGAFISFPGGNTLRVGASNTGTGGNSVFVGSFAGRNNTQQNNTNVGHFAGVNSNVAGTTAVGSLALQNNIRANVTGIGYEAGINNTGSNILFAGWRAGYLNEASNSTFLGYDGSERALGTNHTSVGYNSFGYITGSNNTNLGANSWNFIADPNNQVVIPSSNIDVTNNRITISNHGLTGKVYLYYRGSTGTNAGGVITTVPQQWTVIDSDTLQFENNISNAGTGDHTFDTQLQISNSTSIGASANPTQSNQIMLGGSSVTSVRTSNPSYVASHPQDFVTLSEIDGFIPYTGATSPLDLGSNSITAGTINGATLGVRSSNNTYFGTATNQGSGNNTTKFGTQAGRYNTASNISAFGMFALNNNSQPDNTGVGYYSGANNTGNDVTAVGSYSLQLNTGNDATAIGDESGLSNKGSDVTFTGHASGRENFGNNSTFNGANSGIYNDFNNNTGLGALTFSFSPDNSNQKTVSSTNVDTSLNRITVAGHGFTIGDFIHLQYSSTDGTAIGGMTVGIITYWEVIDANTLEVKNDNLTTQGVGNHVFTPQVNITNSTALGYNAQPNQSNQVVLGNSSVTSVRTLNSSYSPSHPQDFVTLQNTYDRLIESSSVTGTYNIDYNLGETWLLTLTGDTTFTESNLPLSGVYTKTISLHVTGAHSLTFPSGWSTYISGSYDGAVMNTIVVEYIKANTYKVSISQPD